MTEEDNTKLMYIGLGAVLGIIIAYLLFRNTPQTLSMQSSINNLSNQQFQLIEQKLQQLENKLNQLNINKISALNKYKSTQDMFDMK